jgi:hypothetical protein
MGYMHIDNLYKNQDILMFKECYALEKIHGTSSHISWNNNNLVLFAGGEKHEKFKACFDVEKLKTDLKTSFDNIKLTIYGEAYGGKCQGMSDTYGKELKFIAFDVRISDMWLSVPDAEKIVKDLNIEFVDYVKLPTDVELLNKERDKPSTQAIRNGCGDDKIREGIVLRPLIEVTKNNGSRIISKHKGDAFLETKTKREVSPEQMKILSDAKEIAQEWVTPMRLSHVLDKLGNPTEIEKMGIIIKAMQEDVLRESEGEIEKSPLALKYIGNQTAWLFKQKLKGDLKC